MKHRRHGPRAASPTQTTDPKFAEAMQGKFTKEKEFAAEPALGDFYKRPDGVWVMKGGNNEHAIGATA